MSLQTFFANEFNFARELTIFNFPGDGKTIINPGCIVIFDGYSTYVTLPCIDLLAPALSYRVDGKAVSRFIFSIIAGDSFAVRDEKLILVRDGRNFLEVSIEGQDDTPEVEKLREGIRKSLFAPTYAGVLGESAGEFLQKLETVQTWAVSRRDRTDSLQYAFLDKIEGESYIIASDGKMLLARRIPLNEEGYEADSGESSDCRVLIPEKAEEVLRKLSPDHKGLFIAAVSDDSDDYCSIFSTNRPGTSSDPVYSVESRVVPMNSQRIFDYLREDDCVKITLRRRVLDDFIKIVPKGWKKEGLFSVNVSVQGTCLMAAWPDYDIRANFGQVASDNLSPLKFMLTVGVMKKILKQIPKKQQEVELTIRRSWFGDDEMFEGLIWLRNADMIMMSMCYTNWCMKSGIESRSSVFRDDIPLDDKVILFRKGSSAGLYVLRGFEEAYVSYDSEGEHPFYAILTREMLAAVRGEWVQILVKTDAYGLPESVTISEIAAPSEETEEVDEELQEV